MGHNQLEKGCRHSKQREQHMKRCRDVNRHGVFEEQQVIPGMKHRVRHPGRREGHKGELGPYHEEF